MSVEVSAGHCAQFEAFTDAYRPEYFPTSQSVQNETAWTSEYFPGRHSSQELAAAKAE